MIELTSAKQSRRRLLSKINNPTKLPEARPIEDFWSILKGEVYKNN